MVNHSQTPGVISKNNWKPNPSIPVDILEGNNVPPPPWLLESGYAQVDCGLNDIASFYYCYLLMLILDFLHPFCVLFSYDTNACYQTFLALDTRKSDDSGDPVVILSSIFPAFKH